MPQTTRHKYSDDSDTDIYSIRLGFYEPALQGAGTTAAVNEAQGIRTSAGRRSIGLHPRRIVWRTAVGTLTAGGTVYARHSLVALSKAFYDGIAIGQVVTLTIGGAQVAYECVNRHQESSVA
jgi:hypothetical protein